QLVAGDDDRLGETGAVSVELFNARDVDADGFQVIDETVITLFIDRISGAFVARLQWDRFFFLDPGGLQRDGELAEREKAHGATVDVDAGVLPTRHATLELGRNVVAGGIRGDRAGGERILRRGTGLSGAGRSGAGRSGAGGCGPGCSGGGRGRFGRVL